MKRIEIFEEGFFITLFAEGGSVSIAAASPSVPYSEENCRGRESLPCVCGGQLVGYTDTGNQTGRLIRLEFADSSGCPNAAVSFQFYKGRSAVCARIEADSAGAGEMDGGFFSRLWQLGAVSTERDGSSFCEYFCQAENDTVQ